jgi:NAD(P)-dependent dehydrogenase (short-subunit alcohol dehydrogenase family)
MTRLTGKIIQAKPNPGANMLPNFKRIALITGGNSGIGFAAASKLAARGFHVILAARNQAASAQAIARIQASQPEASLEAMSLDLASFASVRQCVAAFQAKGLPLQVLINNAGGAVYGKKASFTVDGFEMTLGTNHLGHFLLTNLLLETLKQSAPARVVTVSSELHNPAHGGKPYPDFDYDNLKGENTTSPRFSTATRNWRTCGSPTNCSGVWQAPV